MNATKEKPQFNHEKEDRRPSRRTYRWRSATWGQIIVKPSFINKFWQVTSGGHNTKVLTNNYLENRIRQVIECKLCRNKKRLAGHQKTGAQIENRFIFQFVLNLEAAFLKNWVTFLSRFGCEIMLIQFNGTPLSETVIFRNVSNDCPHRIDAPGPQPFCLNWF